jgi:hypothetical protein
MNVIYSGLWGFLKRWYCLFYLAVLFPNVGMAVSLGHIEVLSDKYSHFLATIRNSGSGHR